MVSEHRRPQPQHAERTAVVHAPPPAAAIGVAAAAWQQAEAAGREADVRGGARVAAADVGGDVGVVLQRGAGEQVESDPTERRGTTSSSNTNDRHIRRWRRLEASGRQHGAAKQ